MNNPLLTGLSAALIIGSASLTAFAESPTGKDVSLAEFQDSMMEHIYLTGSPYLLQRFGDLEHEHWQSMYDMFPQRKEFMAATKAMARLADESGSIPVSDVKSKDKGAPSLQALIFAQAFSPAYPSHPAGTTMRLQPRCRVLAFWSILRTSVPNLERR